jgi:hypothetical protein
MQFNSREDIKGDCSIEARGVSVLLVKEMQQQVLMALANQWTVHPTIGPMMKTYDLIASTLRSFSIDPSEVMVSKDDYKKVVEAMQAQAAEGGEDPANAPAVIAAQTNLQRAQLEADTALQIAQLNRDTELMKLAEQRNMTIDKLKAMLVQTDMGLKSKERIFAGELGFEAQNAREARARGEQPAGSGGYVSAGDEPAGAEA